MKTRYRIRKHGINKDGNPRYYFQELKGKRVIFSKSLRPNKKLKDQLLK